MVLPFFCEGSSATLGVSNAIYGNGSGWSNSNNTNSINVNSSGSYSYTNNNGCGSSVSNTINIIKNANPSLTSTSPIELCTDNDLNYTLSANEPCNYSWSATNNFNVDGGNSGTGSDRKSVV